jgi:ligand-binding sensor domain-containing protein
MARAGLIAGAAAMAAAALPVQPAQAQAPALSGHAVQALAWFAGTAYAGTDGGLFRLAAGTWTAVSAVPPTRVVNALAVAGSTLVAGTDTGAIRSGDGTTWTAAGLSGQNVAGLDVAGGVLLAGTGHEGGTDGLAFRSDDGGASWNPAVSLPAAEGLPGAEVQAVLAPSGGRPAWAGTAGSGALLSGNGSGGWSDGSGGLPSKWVTSFWRDPASPGSLLAGTDGGLVQRGASSSAWAVAAFPQQQPWIQALATGPGGSPLAGTYDGAVFQRSGSGWTSIGANLPSVLALLAVPADQGGGVLVGTFDGAYCLGCRASLGAPGAPSSARPGATPLPAVANRPGASSSAAAASASASAGATSAGASDASPGSGVVGAAGAGASGGGTGGGVPTPVWVAVAVLLGVSAALTAWGVRRSRRADA